MKKTVVICLADDKAETVEKLRELGIVHVVETTRPESDELDTAQRRRDDAVRALTILDGFAEDIKTVEADDDTSEPSDLVSKTLNLCSEINHLEERETHFHRIHEQLQPWGSFSRETLSTLQERGLKIILCAAPQGEVPEIPDSACYREISRQGKSVYFVVVAPDSVDIDIPHFHVPELTDMNEVEAAIQDCEHKLAKKREA